MVLPGNKTTDPTSDQPLADNKAPVETQKSSLMEKMESPLLITYVPAGRVPQLGPVMVGPDGVAGEEPVEVPAGVELCVGCTTA